MGIVKNYNNLINSILEINSIEDFNEMQKLVLNKNWGSSNLVISSPTASGKTLVAELVALNTILNKNKKVLYICPLRAIAYEHYNSFKIKYAKRFGIRVAVSTGDLDSSSSYLSSYDIIFSTFEKIDSLIRHKSEWLSSIGLLIIDEVHFLDSDRGPTLEVIVGILTQMNKDMQVIALSATIPNAEDISGWLNADLVISNYRPVKLVEKIYFDGVLYNGSEEFIDKLKTPLDSILLDTLQKDKQILIFVNTRKNAQSYAEKSANLVSSYLANKEKKYLNNLSEKILSCLDSPTKQCELLANLIKKGVAFHHAGLLQKQRDLVENAFRKNLVKVLFATPTLAAGVNLPAFRVLISSLYRYSGAGNSLISVNEYKQMIGRAGRPKYDVYGESIIIARSKSELSELYNNYVKGDLENIYSRFSNESLLRTHLLSLISTGFVYDLLSLEDFIKRTFYYHQNKNFDCIGEIMPLLKQLEEFGFIEGNEERFYATKLGKRVAELYLDPVSAYKMINMLKLKKDADLFYLFLIANTYEFAPWFAPSKENEEEVYALLYENMPNIGLCDKDLFNDYSILEKFNTVLMLNDWINENNEEQILEKYNLSPGLLYNKLEISDWLVYSAFELSKLLDLSYHYKNLTHMRIRLKYGVKEELLPLVSVKGIGRVRARKLYNANIKTIQELKNTDIKDLSRLIGIKTAEHVLKHLNTYK